MKTLRKYLSVWWVLTLKSTKVAFISRFGAFIFLIGKLARYAFFIVFILIIISKTQGIVGYNVYQIIFFYLTFNLIDTATQFFLREVYRFRYYVTSGDFDYILMRPISPLFRSLFGGCDILDLLILVLSIASLFFVGGKVGGGSLISVLIYVSLLVNGFLIALAFHVIVLAMGILTTEVDNTIILYRDVTVVGRLPVDIFHDPLRSFLTFVIPVGVMMTFPAKAFMGFLSWEGVGVSFVLGAVFFIGSILFWRYALERYASASS